MAEHQISKDRANSGQAITVAAMMVMHPKPSRPGRPQPEQAGQNQAGYDWSGLTQVFLPQAGLLEFNMLQKYGAKTRKYWVIPNNQWKDRNTNKLP